MAISLGDIKKKKVKVPTISMETFKTKSPTKESSNSNKQTISLADIRTGKSKIEPIKTSTKNHVQQYNLDGSKKIAPTVSIISNNIANKGATNLVNNTLQQDIKNKTFEVATGQNKQKINLAGDSNLTKAQKQELRELLEKMTNNSNCSAQIGLGNHAYAISKVENGRVYLRDPYNMKVEFSITIEEAIEDCRSFSITNFD